MTVKELEEVMIKDGSINDSWVLYTNSQDISDIILGWGLSKQVALSEVGCLFVEWDMSGLDLNSVFYMESSTPFHSKQVYPLQLPEKQQ